MRNCKLLSLCRCNLRRTRRRPAKRLDSMQQAEQPTEENMVVVVPSLASYGVDASAPKAQDLSVSHAVLSAPSRPDVSVGGRLSPACSAQAFLWMAWPACKLSPARRQCHPSRSRRRSPSRLERRAPVHRRSTCDGWQVVRRELTWPVYCVLTVSCWPCSRVRARAGTRAGDPAQTCYLQVYRLATWVARGTWPDDHRMTL